jgi:hypothetical protein
MAPCGYGLVRTRCSRCTVEGLQTVGDEPRFGHRSFARLGARPTDRRCAHPGDSRSHAPCHLRRPTVTSLRYPCTTIASSSRHGANNEWATAATARLRTARHGPRSAAAAWKRSRASRRCPAQSTTRALLWFRCDAGESRHSSVSSTRLARRVSATARQRQSHLQLNIATSHNCENDSPGCAPGGAFVRPSSVGERKRAMATRTCPDRASGRALRPAPSERT